MTLRHASKLTADEFNMEDKHAMNNGRAKISKDKQNIKTYTRAISMNKLKKRTVRKPLQTNSHDNRTEAKGKNKTLFIKESSRSKNEAQSQLKEHHLILKSKV